MTYSVKEVLCTLQGEGQQAGQPAAFCRFCDTDVAGTDGPGGDKFERSAALAAHIASFRPRTGGGRRFAADGRPRCAGQYHPGDAVVPGPSLLATAPAQAAGHTLMFELSQTFFFEAAHTLERVRETESSCRVHGHTYGAEGHMQGEPGSNGMVVDLARLRAVIAEVRDWLAPHFADDISDLGPATLENMCLYIHRHVPARCCGSAR